MSMRKFLVGLIDTVGYFIIYTCVSLLCFFILPQQSPAIYKCILNALIIYISIFSSRLICHIYSNIWRHASTPVYLKIVFCDFCGAAAGILLSFLCRVGFFPLTDFLSVSLFTLFTLTNRFVYRKARDSHRQISGANKINVAIVGAGKVGVLLAKELTFNVNSKYHPCCFVDSNTHKVGNYVAGLKVYPESEKTPELLKSLQIQEIFIALPKINSEELQKVYKFYEKTNLKIKIYDLPVALLNDPHSGDKLRLREFKIEDLLFRNSIEVDSDFLRSYYKGKTVLVTGGGGSIGSELCRQLARFEIKKLIIFDIYENNAYSIEQELKAKYNNSLDFTVEIGSVRDIARLEFIFRAYRPDVVFHAAAHKHVPLMEHSCCEAIKNNVIGTYNTANLAEKYGVQKFILISTDKAVNPTNVMGASKRMCEMIVQCRADSDTSFVAVRFGNVLGSNGSVIPLFKHQIECGGPITLTDKRIIRYFMTIPEASQLLMQAGVMAKSGELFVLDMGKPVKILDLAENMIRLSGLTPYKDIDIIEIGLRPGEKLYEELLIKTENMKQTPNSKIFIEKDTPFTRDEVDRKIKILTDAVKLCEDDYLDSASMEAIIRAMKVTVPSYKDADTVNKSALQSEEMKIALTK